MSAQIGHSVAFLARLLGGLAIALVLTCELANAKDIPSGIIAWQPTEVHPVFVLPIREGETPQEAALFYLHQVRSNPEIAPEGPRDEHLPNALSGKWRFVDLSSAPRDGVLLVANRPTDHQTQDRRILEMSRPFIERRLRPFILPVGAALRFDRPGRKVFHQRIARHFHGLTLLGGADLSPRIYRRKLTYSQATNELRDRLEIELLKDYIAEDSGFVLGICRGAQLINVAHGGQMHQDIGEILRSPLQHGTGEAGQPNVGHIMRLLATPNGLLGEALGIRDLAHARPIEVNSYHHQAMKVAPGSKVRVAAVSEDGVVEAIEVGDKVLGIQSHPERVERPGSNTFGSMVFDFVADRVRALSGSHHVECRELLRASSS